ncbi:hypothetical protein [Desulfitobacterium chlororespirans]|uniref:hypothetical protein n=1 Tax=Desulfitobacterium chlororespirans TaxID=51616 RepID=UPI0015B71ADA|nr:hypothetical protein [Desulfitobacterium chlororespirans]
MKVIDNCSPYLLHVCLAEIKKDADSFGECSAVSMGPKALRSKKEEEGGKKL